jgi:hypothetical protein
MDSSKALASNEEEETEKKKFDYITNSKQLDWFTVNPAIRSFSGKIADLWNQMADRMPYYVISIRMIAKVLEGLSSLPNEESHSVGRVKSAIAAAKDRLFDMPGDGVQPKKERLVVYIPDLGYRATVDALDKSRNAIDQAARRADQSNKRAAKYVLSINVNEIPDVPENQKDIAKVKIFGQYARNVEKGIANKDKLIQALNLSKLLPPKKPK